MANNCWNLISIDVVKKEDFSKVEKFFADYKNNSYTSDWVKSSFLNEHLGILGLTEDQADNPYDVSGSKWFEFNIDFMKDGDGGYITISGDSAWGPMVPLTHLLSKALGTKAEIEYYEGGCDFAGRAIFNNGEVIEDSSWKYFEGLYNIDEEYFCIQATDHLEHLAGEGMTEEEFLNEVKETFGFVSPYEWADFEQEAKDIYKDAKENQEV